MITASMQFVTTIFSQCFEWMMVVYNAVGAVPLVLAALSLLIAVGYLFASITVQPSSDTAFSMDSSEKSRKQGGTRDGNFKGAGM